MNNSKQLSPIQWLIIFIATYLLLWCVIPALQFNSVFPDTAENLALSHVLSWSYAKHPPLGMALLHIIQSVIPSPEWAAALGNALCLSLGLLGTFFIARHKVGTTEAVAITLLSSLSLYFMINFAIQYNQNTIMLPFWVGIILFTIRALDFNKPLDWLLLSITAALGILAKYETLMIIGLAGIYALIHLKKEHVKYLLATCVLCLLILLPHILWVAQHHFETIHYLLHESNRGESTHRLTTFAGALLAQPCNLILPILLCFLFKPLGALQTNARQPLNWREPLLYFAIIPWLSFSLLALFMTVKAEWGYTLFVATLPAVFYYWSIKITNLRKIVTCIIGLHGVILIAYTLNMTLSHKTHRINWPSYQLAKTASSFWKKHTHSEPLRYIGGQIYPIFYLTAYSQNKPLMLKRNSFKISSWVKPIDFYQRGAIFVEQGCHTSKDPYQEMGFPITKTLCVSLPQANKWIQPRMESFTFYLLPPNSLEQ